MITYVLDIVYKYNINKKGMVDGLTNFEQETFFGIRSKGIGSSETCTSGVQRLSGLPPRGFDLLVAAAKAFVPRDRRLTLRL